MCGRTAKWQGIGIDPAARQLALLLLNLSWGPECFRIYGFCASDLRAGLQTATRWSYYS